MRFNRPIRPDQLEAELLAAGVEVSGIGTVGDRVFTYDEQGLPMELPKEARAVLKAHEPTPPDQPVSPLAALVKHLQAQGALGDDLPPDVQQLLERGSPDPALWRVEPRPGEVASVNALRGRVSPAMVDDWSDSVGTSYQEQAGLYSRPKPRRRRA